MKPKFIRFIRYILILICVLLVISLANNISKSRNMQETLQKAEKSLQEAIDIQESLEQDLAIVESNYFLEKEARNKLGLVKENEIVLVLPDEEVLKKLSPRKEMQNDYQLPDPNWKKWLKLFI